jgi:hypothetical protein
MGWHAKPPGTIEFTFGPPGEVKKCRAFARLCRRGPGVPAQQKPGIDDYRGVPGGEYFLREGLPEQIEVAVYYVVSEALTNAGCAYDSH